MAFRKYPVSVLAAAAMLSPLGATSCAAAQPASPRAAQLQDIDAFERDYVARERAFTPETRARARALLAGLRARAGALSADQLFLGIAEVVAAADNGHSVVGFDPSAMPDRMLLPVRMAAIDDEGWLILRAAAPFGALAGGVVTRIEGVPVAEVMRRASAYYGGLPARRAILAMGLVATRGILQAMGIAPHPDRLTVTVRDRQGHSADHDLPYLPEASLGGVWWPSRWWSPAPIPGSPAQWTTAVAPDAAPLYLQNPDSYFQIAALPELDALYLELWTNEGQRGLRAFLDQASARLRQPVRNLIVDLRFDKGGDLSLSADFFTGLPRALLPGGRIYVIVGRYTFSAGIVAAALIRNAGGPRVTIVGELVGDRLRFWSEGGTACTPNSHICGRYTDGYFDLVDGCADEPGCFRDNLRWNFVVGRLEPDIAAPITTAAYLAGRDPAMEAIARDIRASRGAAPGSTR